MTDDEAFVRAIVDRPGDDLPRLVYADWLDEHADPRGVYVRAETSWATTRESNAQADLSSRGNLLDPIWVARISRPPVGVFCDRKLFKASGPALSEYDLDRFEAEAGLPLTGDYRAFMSNMNGGVPPLDGPRAHGSRWTPPLQCFYRLVPTGHGSDRCNLLHHTCRFRSDLPSLLAEELLGAGPDEEDWQADAIPIADTGRDFTLFYAVRGRHAGRLHLHDYTGDWCRFGWIAGTHEPPTLPEFLHKLIEHRYTLVDTFPSQPLQEFWFS